MEFLEKLGALFNGFLRGVERFITGLFGSSNERRVRQIGFVRDKQGKTEIVSGSLLDRINSLEPEFERLSDDDLRQTTPKFRERLARGQTLDDLLPEAFAAVREAGKRYLKMRHYDVQMVGGIILHRGMIAEMMTGEGKTLVASLPTFLNALAGHVHVVTVNDYLAKRDMEWMGPLHMGLGLTIGAIQSNMGNRERQAMYGCDITYGTNNEFGFDYLRDNMKHSRSQQVQGPLDYAIVDEIDNILIDEARTPLIISGPAEDDITKYPKADSIARQLVRDVHFEVKEKEHTCHLTDVGIRAAEELAGVESFYTAGNMEWPHLIDNALRAHHLYKRDVNYMVEHGEVVIVDEHTGRKMEGRQWSDGLHQAVEAKERVRIKQESQTLATVTLQNFFKLYKKLAGMTGTAMTEANEFWKIYSLDVVAVPTNRPTQRITFPDAIYRTLPEKWDAVVQEIGEVHQTGRPVLVGTVSIENSELLSGKLTRHGIKHAVLNAKHHEREAEIIAQAGRKSAVTIATNMAGRGTDIILGGNPEYLAWDELKTEYGSRLDVPKSVWDATTRAIAEREGMAVEGREVASLGGLHVVGTERHDSRRIDLQLRGRAGRQGDPGSSRFFLSLEDDLMRKFAGEWIKDALAMLGMQPGERIEHRMVTNRIEAAQMKVEERHFDIRKHLLEYDEVMDEQRKRVYGYRQDVLNGKNCRSLILAMIDRQLDHWIKVFFSPNYRWDSVVQWVRQQFHVELEVGDIRGSSREQLEVFIRDEAERQLEAVISEKIRENLPEEVESDRDRNWGAMARWVNQFLETNTNETELKRVGLEELPLFLIKKSRDSIARYDLSPLEHFLEDQYPRRALCGWAKAQYDLDFRPEQFENLAPEKAAELIRTETLKLYRRQEIQFPVSVALQKLSSNQGMHKEGLADWANSRFEANVEGLDWESLPRNEIVRRMHEISEQYLRRGDVIDQLGKLVDAACTGRTTGETSPGLQHLVDWANREFKATLEAPQLAKRSRDEIEQAVLTAYNTRYRTELAEAENLLILEMLDSSWKDHLYFMGHLREQIGLVSYAQRDPKTEYRREGMRAFEEMWTRIGDNVTGAVFRLQNLNPDFVGSLWEISSTTHAEYQDEPAPPAPQPGEPVPAGGSSNGTSPDVAAIETIRNFRQTVGRNDPCPCGSGKKFKKCHGAG